MLYVLHLSNNCANGATLKLMSKEAFCRRYGITQSYDAWRDDFNALYDVFEHEEKDVIEDVIKSLSRDSVIGADTAKQLLLTLELLP